MLISRKILMTDAVDTVPHFNFTLEGLRILRISQTSTRRRALMIVVIIIINMIIIKIKKSCVVFSSLPSPCFFRQNALELVVTYYDWQV